jgi:hypothetical protein
MTHDLDTHVFLQLLNARGECRLRNIAAFGRVAKMAFTVQSKQVFKVSYDHIFSSDKVD